METAAQFDKFIRKFGEKINDDQLLITSPQIQKGLVFYLYTQCKQKKDFITRLITVATKNSIVDERNINVRAWASSAIRLVKDIKSKKRSNLKRSGKNLIIFLNECFHIPCVRQSSEKNSAPADGLDRPTVPQTFEKRKLVEDTVPVKCVAPSQKILKSDCKKCMNRRKIIKNLSQLCKDRKRALDDSIISNSEKKTMKQALERKQKIEIDLRKERRNLKKKVIELQAEIKKLRTDNTSDVAEKKKKKRSQTNEKLVTLQT